MSLTCPGFFLEIVRKFLELSRTFLEISRNSALAQAYMFDNRLLTVPYESMILHMSISFLYIINNDATLPVVRSEGESF